MTQITDTYRGIRMQATAENTAEIFLYDVIGPSELGPGIRADDFRRDLEALGSEITDINVYVNSPGGGVFEGHALVQVLQRHSARKHVFIDGIAGSMASVLICLGDTVQISESGCVMIHLPFDANNPEAGDPKSMEILGKITEQMLSIYTARTKQTRKQLLDWMRAETWFFGEEAVDAGFADSTYPAMRMAASFDLAAFGYRNAPKQPIIQSAEALELRARIAAARKNVQEMERADIRKRLAAHRAYEDMPESMRAARRKREFAARERFVDSHPNRKVGAHEGGHKVMELMLGVESVSMIVHADNTGSAPALFDHLSDRDRAKIYMAGVCGEYMMGFSNEIEYTGTDRIELLNIMERLTGERDLDTWAAKELQYEVCDDLERYAVAHFALTERVLQTVDEDVPGVECHRIFDASPPSDKY